MGFLSWSDYKDAGAPYGKQGYPKWLHEKYNAEIERLQRDLGCYSNPWTVEVQSSTGQWFEFAHDAPLTLADAEARIKEHQAKSPRATFRVMPWMNSPQRQALERLRRENAELLEEIATLKSFHCNYEHATKLDRQEAEAKLAAAEAALVSSKAETIARAAHAGQKDTVNGNDYILHVERVVARVDGEETKAVAWLHDVLEDTSITACGLRAAGIPESVVFSVLVLTKQEGAIYENYIRRILAVGDQSALGVKRADIEDHLHANCPERLRPRYENARQVLAIDAAKTEVRAAHVSSSDRWDWDTDFLND